MYLPTYFQLREYIQNVFRTSIFMSFFVTCTRFYVRSRGSFLSSTTFQYKVLLNNLVLMMPIIFLLQIHRSTNRKGEGVLRFSEISQIYVQECCILNSAQGHLSSNCEKSYIQSKSCPFLGVEYGLKFTPCPPSIKVIQSQNFFIH